MVGRVTGGKMLPPEVLDQILAKTDGVPLFLEELTKTVLESGLLREVAEGYAVTGPLPSLAIPSTLRDSLMARLDRLAPVKEVAQMGAVIGREFAYQLLAAVSLRGDDALRDALAQLVRSELVFHRGQPPQAVYTFKHALVQDTAYQSLLKSRRRQLHARIAEVLEQRFPDRAAAEPELLAHHFTEAGSVERAVPYWQRAGERAGARSANAEAASHLRSGLALLSALPESPERSRQELALQVALGVALMATRGSGASETATTYARARELCERLGDKERLLPVLYGEWGTRYIPAEEDKARALANRFAGLAERDEDARLVAERMLALHCFARGALGQARTHLERILAGYDPERHQALVLRFGYDARAAALSYMSWILWHLGYPEQGLRASEEAATWAGQIAHANSKGMTLSFGVAMLRQFLRDAATVEGRARSLVELCDEMRLPLWRGYGQVLGGWAAAAQGRAEDGLAAVTSGLRELREINAGRHLPYLLGLLAEVQAGAGRIEDGLATVAEALEVVRRSGDHGWEGDLHRIRGDLLRAAGGQDGAAETALEEAVEVARRHHARSLELRAVTRLAQLRALRGQRRQAHDLLAPIYGWFTEGLDTPDLQDARAVLDELR
jgi:predicted ATPase